MGKARLTGCVMLAFAGVVPLTGCTIEAAGFAADPGGYHEGSVRASTAEAVVGPDGRCQSDISIDPASVRMRLDGRDVTPKAHVAAGQVRFGDGLRPGRHVAEVVVRDRAGNTSRASWSFQVAARDAHGYNHG